MPLILMKDVFGALNEVTDKKVVSGIIVTSPERESAKISLVKSKGFAW